MGHSVEGGTRLAKKVYQVVLLEDSEWPAPRIVASFQALEPMPLSPTKYTHLKPAALSLLVQ